MDIIAAVGSVKTAWDALATAIETKKNVDLNAIKLDMYGKLFELQGACSALRSEADALGKEKAELESLVRELERKIDERAKYELCEPHPGTFVYRVKEEERGVEPRHYVCPQCLEKDLLKSILQLNGSMHDATWGTCPHCKAGFRFGENTIMTARSEYDPYGRI